VAALVIRRLNQFMEQPQAQVQREGHAVVCVIDVRPGAESNRLRVAFQPGSTTRRAAVAHLPNKAPNRKTERTGLGKWSVTRKVAPDFPIGIESAAAGWR
jgi:hypothetical protein